MLQPDHPGPWTRRAELHLARSLPLTYCGLFNYCGAGRSVAGSMGVSVESGGAVHLRVGANLVGDAAQYAWFLAGGGFSPTTYRENALAGALGAELPVAVSARFGDTTLTVGAAPSAYANDQRGAWSVPGLELRTFGSLAWVPGAVFGLRFEYQVRHTAMGVLRQGTVGYSRYR